ncbi:hypothetical protein PoB_004621800 [Plakobranchus ocellatus]|uniref:Uncharacterized protein n=1 Tax=Plakobranchus ocellatus TaxID=259542 RepID=A0AAV4BKN0_9GAST|nr:hypothetical protein PoB_004621800 [Plakobranchus ocellatus]
MKMSSYYANILPPPGSISPSTINGGVNCSGDDNEGGMGGVVDDGAAMLGLDSAGIYNHQAPAKFENMYSMASPILGQSAGTFTSGGAPGGPVSYENCSPSYSPSYLRYSSSSSTSSGVFDTRGENRTPLGSEVGVIPNTKHMDAHHALQQQQQQQQQQHQHMQQQQGHLPPLTHHPSLLHHLPQHQHQQQHAMQQQHQQNSHPHAQHQHQPQSLQQPHHHTSPELEANNNGQIAHTRHSHNANQIHLNSVNNNTSTNGNTSNSSHSNSNHDIPQDLHPNHIHHQQQHLNPLHPHHSQQVDHQHPHPQQHPLDAQSQPHHLHHHHHHPHQEQQLSLHQQQQQQQHQQHSQHPQHHHHHMDSLTPPMAHQYPGYSMNGLHHPGNPELYYDNRMMDCKGIPTEMCTPPHMGSYYYPQQSMPDPSGSPNGYNPGCMPGMGSPNMPVYPWMRQANGGPPPCQGVGGGARTYDRRVPADLRADSLATVLPKP